MVEVYGRVSGLSHHLAPKTGSTWLAENLRHHPDLFVPSIKEIKYFSSFFKSLDLSWYLDQIAPGAGRIKGEASPSYALLPVERIRLIRCLMPNVKIIFLMRDPIARAWSHARHNHRYREANFLGCTTPVHAVDDQLWMENFTQDWPLMSGDYLGQLQRWLSIFPRNQVYVGFFESIANAPEVLFREVLDFLGASQDVNLSEFPIHERILPGPDCELSGPLRSFLHSLLHGRSLELTTYLRDELGIVPPPEWQDTLEPATASPGSAVAPASRFVREFDDAFLSQLLKQEEAFPSAWCPVIGAYQGFNMVFHRGLVYALDVNLGNVQPADLTEEQLRRYQLDYQCFIAPSLAQLKAFLDQYLFDRAEAGLAQLPRLNADLYNARNGSAPWKSFSES